MVTLTKPETFVQIAVCAMLAKLTHPAWSVKFRIAGSAVLI
jgi:hypothetical protein